jgi:AcrR family transcriptional regulator
VVAQSALHIGHYALRVVTRNRDSLSAEGLVWVRANRSQRASFCVFAPLVIGFWDAGEGCENGAQQRNEVPMASSGGVARRVGVETSKTRDRLLDCVERIMVDRGYAGVSYRALAASAGVTSGLVQYYFPTRDDLFVAAIRRRGEQNLARVTEALEARADEPLRVLWEFSQEESTAALTTEFLALGNHRKSIRAEIADVTERVRRVQLQAVEAKYGKDGIGDGSLSTAAFLFVLTGIPRLIRLETAVGASTAHTDVVQALERYLDTVEPVATRRRKRAR